MPTSLSRLSSCLSSILSFLECPICFEIISPPAHQCPLGHLICFRCRVYIDRCPICRTGFTRERSLLADQIYNSIIDAFHLNQPQPGAGTGERAKKLWERVFGRRKRGGGLTGAETSPQSPAATPKFGRAFDFKSKFLTRLIGKSSSVDNLADQSIFSVATAAALRKKSISSTDIYPDALKKLGSGGGGIGGAGGGTLNDAYSAESLPGSPRLTGVVGANIDNRYLSPYSAAVVTANSCETLNAAAAGGRNARCYYKRLRTPHMTAKGGAGGGCHLAANDHSENLFQFSSEALDADDDDEDESFRCPLSDACDPRTAFSLLTHLQEHDGPVIQYFRPHFTVHFPFSFRGGATVFVVHCYEKTFYTRLDVGDEDDDAVKTELTTETTTTTTSPADGTKATTAASVRGCCDDDIRVHFWIMDSRTEAARFKLKVTLRDDQSNGRLEFKTLARSIRATAAAENVGDLYRHQILVAKSTLEVCFGDQFYSLDFHIKERKL